MIEAWPRMEGSVNPNSGKRQIKHMIGGYTRPSRASRSEERPRAGTGQALVTALAGGR